MYWWCNILCVNGLLFPSVVQPAFLKTVPYCTHKYVTANGIKFHCVTSGDKEKPLMLFLHGFPEVRW